MNTATPDRPPTYEHDVDDWRRTLARYPPELRDPGPVVEERHRWRGVDVHVDRVPAPDAPLTVVIVHGGGGYGRLFTPFARLLAGGRAGGGRGARPARLRADPARRSRRLRRLGGLRA